MRRRAAVNTMPPVPTPPSKAARQWSLVAAIVMMAVWGANFAVTKIVLAEIGVAVFLCIRFIWMPVLGFGLIAWVYRGRWREALPLRADLPRFIVCGLLGHTAHVGIVTWGINFSTAFSSALVLTSGPVFTLLILAALKQDKLQRPQMIGTLVAFAGIVLFLSDKFVAGLARAGFGDLVLLLAAGLFSLYTVLARPLTARYGPLLLIAWTLAFGAPVLVLLTLPAMLSTSLTGVSTKAWLLLFWASTVSAFLGWLVWAWVNQVRGVAKSAPLQYLMPPIAGVVSWLTLGEQFTWVKIGGALVVMSGVAYAQFAGRSVVPVEKQVDAG